MTISQIKIEKKIAKTLTANSSNSIFALFSNTPYSKPGYRTVQENHLIENLKIVHFLKSISAIDFPQIPLEFSESEKDKILLDLQWKSPRIHLNIYLESEGQNRQLLEFQSLLRTAYPYATIDLGNYPLGNNSNIAVSIANAGFGLLQGEDRVVIHGDLISTIYLEKVSEGKLIQNTITGTASLIIPENSNRKGFTIANTTNANIYLDIVPTVSLSSYMVHIESGDYYESPFVLNGNIYMITDSINPISIQIREFT